MRNHALITVAVLLTACASTPPPVVTPPPLPRAQPVESMQACRVNPCRLTSDYDTASAEDQAKLELRCAAENAHAARECARRQVHLAEWIKVSNPTP